MKYRVNAVAISLAAIGLLALAPAPEESSAERPLTMPGEEIEWFIRYSDALDEARRTGKPIFLEFRCVP